MSGPVHIADAALRKAIADEREAAERFARDYLAAQAGNEATLPTPRRARCWHPWRAQHTHAGVTRWRCRGCCGCGEAS